MSKQIKSVSVVLAGGIPSEEELESIEKFKEEVKTNLLFLNGRFVSFISSERIESERVLNLSGRKDIDEFYKDKIIKLKADKPSPKKTEKKAEKKDPAKKAAVKKAPAEKKEKVVEKKEVKKNQKKNNH